ASDSQVSPYADLYLEFDAVHRVNLETVQGQGCSACSSGLGTYSFSSTASAFPEGYNSWALKSVEDLPDGNQNIVFLNFAGQVMLHVYKEVSSGTTWCDFFKYDDDGRLLWHALPSAVSAYDETKADLLDSQSGNYQDLRDSSGL